MPPTAAPQLVVPLRYVDLADTAFLRLVHIENLTTVIGAGWTTQAEMSATPGTVVSEVSYFGLAQEERVIRLGAAICHLILRERRLMVRAAAPDAATARAAIARLAEGLPEVAGSDREVAASFWWLSPSGGEQSIARMVLSPPWREQRANYSAEARAAVDALTAWDDAPPSGGRVVLWHGPPGTGKTNAIRSLLGEWQSWADFHFVTDPESFLGDPGYLLSALTGRRAPQAERPARWRVFVLEDAGEFLDYDARAATGQSLSRLLNVCDGVLGQAMRVLLLVTTNEPISSTHPALSRPGRCLAVTQFGPLDRPEIEAWCRDDSVSPPDIDEATVAELYAHAEGRMSLRPARRFGFASAMGDAASVMG